MGKLGLEEFYIKFGEELSDVERGGPAYEKYCKKMGTGLFDTVLESLIGTRFLMNVVVCCRA